MLADDDTGRRKGLLEHLHRTARFDVASNEDVERGNAGFRIGVDRDVPAVQRGEPGNAFSWRARIEVNMADLRAGHVGTARESPLDMIGIVQPERSEQVYYEMAAGNAGTHPILKPADFRRLPGQTDLGIRHDSACIARNYIFLLGGA
jgi:hypothetical protein